MAANYCFLMDPAPNSAVEEQAIDRKNRHMNIWCLYSLPYTSHLVSQTHITHSIHRIGQTRPVHIKRLIIKDSIEERILNNRRSMAADRPNVSTPSQKEENTFDKKQASKKKRDRHEDEADMGEKTFQRLRQLEALFGCSATVKVTKA